MTTKSRSIQFFNPIDPFHRLFQSYYIDGFSKVLGERPDTIALPSWLEEAASKLSRRASRIQQLNQIGAKLWDERVRGFVDRHVSHVGQYLYSDGGSVRKIAIDSCDQSRVMAPEILEWSDVYFKTNKSVSEDYDPKIQPLVNGNGCLDQKAFDRIESLRGREKDFDIVYISRILGDGRDHGVKVFEQLAKLTGVKKLLMAVIPLPPAWFRKRAAISPELQKVVDRLEALGVPCVRHQVTFEKLWDLSSRSKVVILRQGKHFASTWRTIDLLCMGSAILMDRNPINEWPAPFEEERHFQSLGIRFSPKSPISGPQEDYEAIPEKVFKLLRDKAAQAEISRGARRYFEDHASPAAVGRYILKTSDY